MNVVIVVRDPDYSNEFHTFGETPKIVDVDFGRADLRDPAEFGEWSESLAGQANELIATGTPEGWAAADWIANEINQARVNFGHEEATE